VEGFQKHMSGNRALLKVDGKILGVAIQNADFQDTYGRQRVDGLGHPEARELPIGEISYRINLSRMFISNKRIQDLGLLPKDVETLLTQGGIDIELQDMVSKNTVEHYTGCVIDSNSRSYPKFQLSMNNVTFVALRKIE
jgi:hypothetical protein